MKFILFIGLLFISSPELHAVDDDLSIGADDPFREAVSGRRSATRSRPSRVKAYREMDCLRKNRENKYGLKKRRALTQRLMDNIAPRLEEQFGKHKMSAMERAVIYGNMMQETGYFNTITERASYKKTSCFSVALGMDNASKACKKLQACDNGDSKFFDCKYWPSALHRTSNRKKHCGGSKHPHRNKGKYKRHRGPKKGERYGNRWKGRGLLQQTWCYNYLRFWHGRAKTGDSGIHLPREVLPKGMVGDEDVIWQNQGPQDKAYVSLENPKVYNKLKYCSKDDISKLRKSYKKYYNKELDPFGVLEDPSKLSNHCAKLKSRDGKKSEKTANLLVDSAIEHVVDGGCKVPRARLKKAMKAKGFKSKLMRQLGSKGRRGKEEKIIEGMLKCVLGIVQEARKPKILEALACV